MRSGQFRRSTPARASNSVGGMNSTPATATTSTNPATASIAVANCFVFADDFDKAHDFYHGVLGFTVNQDVRKGDFRWLSLSPGGQPGLEITIQSIGVHPGMSEADVNAMDALLAKGFLGALIFSCDDVDALFAHVVASGAEVLQEPTDMFYGVRDCSFRDPAGNMLRFNTPLPADRIPAPPQWAPSADETA